MSERHNFADSNSLQDSSDAPNESEPLLGDSKKELASIRLFKNKSEPQASAALQMNDGKDPEDDKDNLHAASPEEEYDDEIDTNPSPYERASIISVLNFFYVIKYICKLRKKTTQPITFDDTPRLGKTEEMNHKVIKLETEYQNYRKNHRSPSLFWPIFKIFRGMILKELIAFTISCAAKMLIAFFLSKMLYYLDADQQPEALKWAPGMFLAMLVNLYMNNFHYFQSLKFVIQLKPALIGLMYRKINRLNAYTINQVSIGKIVNIAANELNSFEFQFQSVFGLVLSPFILAAALAILWSLVGAASISGIGFLLLMGPLQYFVTRLSAKYAAKKNPVTDERVKLTNEMIEAIRLLKLYGWETKYAESIMSTRTKELDLLTKIGYCDYLGGSMLVRFSPVFGSFLIFTTYGLLMGGTLTASKVYTTIIVVVYARLYLVLQFSTALRLITETRHTFKRIIQLLEADEDGPKRQSEICRPLDDRNRVEFDNFSAFWENETPANDPKQDEEFLPEIPTLKKLSFTVKRGTLCAIVGRVGSGKTTTLLSFLNEVPKTTGDLRYSGRIAYVEQEPYIYPGTIRSNILFGKLYNQLKYNRIVEAVCLLDDFKEFANGDLTEIGEKGVNLSGGQKARISLARALYSGADIYLLDDPLSAVDAKVAYNIFQKAIRELLKNKTVIFVTHQVHLISEAEQIVVLENGEVQAEGTHDEVIRKVGRMMFALETRSRPTSLHTSFIGASPFSSQLLTSGRRNYCEDFGDYEQLDSQVLIDEILTEREEKEVGNQQITEGNQGKETKGKLITEEKDQSGQVGWGTYWYYIQNAGSFWPLLFFTLNLIIIEVSYVLYTRLVGYCTEGVWSLVFTMKILGLILIAFFLFLVLRHVLYVKFGINAARKLHSKILYGVAGAKIEFFDRNTSGRTLNRFSNDVGVLDRYLLQVQNDVLESLFYFVAVFVTICIKLPWMLLPVFVLITVLLIIVKFLKNAITQGRGIELLTRSPIYSLFSLTLSGLTSIRVYGQENRFIRDFTRLVNRNVRACSFYYDVSRLFAFYYDCTAVIFTCFGIAIMVYINNVDASLIGLACCYMLSTTDYIQFSARQILSHMMLMASTARIKAYTELPQEAPPILASDAQLKQDYSWPSKGGLEFNNVYMKYREDTSHVLKGLSFTVHPAEKIGCVGRTGSGKSSIIQTLFRMVEIDNTAVPDSSIKIDGVDISQVGLKTLRRSLSIIPQTSLVFRGTIRKNIDPFGEHNDGELIAALQETDLWNHVNLLPDGLSTDMSNVSSYFSAGQKQLLCLARVILQNNKILVLDEATANVDFETDNFVQRKIMERFRRSTVFTIAHRLSTVAHYDRVMVIDRGRIRELDHPYKLLVKSVGDEKITNSNGLFASMVLHTGTKHAEMIFKTAKNNYYKNEERD